ncbi:MAG: serine/threonine protein kinase, partial [Myxococcaceae bacterium]|nr:serine/threonine protein kinase [Myxococcaceae bacterium]
MATVGRYELVRKLGAGEASEVFLARVTGPGDFEKLLALKRVVGANAADPRYVERFLAEARTAARLDHPNVVQVFDAGSDAGEHWLTMELVDGPSLDQLLARGRAVPPALALHWAGQLCDALAYAHAQLDLETGAAAPIVHRDVCPANVLLTKSGVAKLGDFGLARAAGATVSV